MGPGSDEAGAIIYDDKQRRKYDAKHNAKILFLDIENTPNLAWIWDFYEQTAVKIYEPVKANEHGEWHLLCVGWKWKGESKTHVIGLTDFPGYAKNKHDDKALCEFVWKLLDEADIVVAHNGKDFDARKLNARFLKHGLLPPSPTRWVDTKVLAKHKFKLNQNTLKYLAEYLGGRQKIDTHGYDLWFKCDSGDMKAWSMMYRYNKRDIDALEDIYEALLPWDDYHPNVSLSSGIGHRCPRCGSPNVKTNPSWWTYLKSYRVRRYRCLDCGRWSKGEREKLPFGVLN